MTTANLMRGAGGGGKGGGSEQARAPVESPDSLRSRQFARILDLVSEGEIGGLVNGAQSIFFDDTPLANADGSYNFSGATVLSVPGTQAQSYMAGFAAVESEAAVNVEVTYAASVTRQIANANVDRVRITVAVPQLSVQNTTTGDISGTSVQIAIDVQANGGGYIEQSLVDGGVISGKTTTRYQRAYELTLSGEAPWDIRVRRLTADSGSASLVNRTWWDSMTEIIDAKLAYPNSAIFGVEVDAGQFPQIPRRGYEIDGLLIQVPSNYDPAARTYSGTWDGTFTRAWSDNPAWCFYDLLTAGRYGLGEFIDATQVDKWALYAIAQYCDERVDDGFGGVEPRFTCNLYLQTREDAYKVLANMASMFRGMSYWSAGAVTAVADMPADVSALYAPANVIDGAFRYQGSARNARHTVALVGWNDPADAYRQKIEYVEDADGIERFGVRETEVVALGCTSRAQAHRAGKWLLYTERLETETVSFAVGLEGVLCAPGGIIQTTDPVRAGVQYGGRLASAAGTAIVLDRAVTLVAGESYTLAVVLADGTIEERAVTSPASSTAAISIINAFSSDPPAQAVWVLASSSVEPETWRVISVAERDRVSFEVVALEHNSGKFSAIEAGVILEPVPTSIISDMPAAPTQLAASESLFESGPGVVMNRVTLSWSGDTGRYAVAYRADNGNWVRMPEAVSQTVTIDALEPGNYTFSVQQVNALGRVSRATELLASVLGKTAPPQDVESFSVTAVNGFALAQWTQSTELDVRVGGYIVIRHAAATSGATWQDGIILDVFPGAMVQALVPLITGTYLAKFLDSSGNYSGNAVSFVATEGMVTGFTTVGTRTEHTAFSGTKTNLTVASSTLKLASGSLWDSVAGNIDDVAGQCDEIGGQSLTGSYAFSTYLDLTTTAVRRFEADITALAVDNSYTWDNQQGNIDDLDGMFDGAVINDCDVTLYAAITNDDPAGAPTWGEWFPFMVADFNCRAAKFKLDFESGSPNHNIGVTVLTVHAKEPV